MAISFFTRKLSGVSNTLGQDGRWPQAGLVEAMEGHFDQVQHLGDEQGYALYGIADRGVNFVIALATPAPQQVTEIIFMARFVGFPLSRETVEGMNRNLHLSIASLENGDLFLLAGVEAAGQYNAGLFTATLEAWRRDLLVVLHALSGSHSFASAFPAAGIETALRFAANPAPQSGGVQDGAQDESGGGAPADLLKAYLAAAPSLAACPACAGRGKTGLIARRCGDCAGSGFVSARAGR